MCDVCIITSIEQPRPTRNLTGWKYGLKHKIFFIKHRCLFSSGAVAYVTYLVTSVTTEPQVRVQFSVHRKKKKKVNDPLADWSGLRHQLLPETNKTKKPGNFAGNFNLKLEARQDYTSSDDTLFHLVARMVLKLRGQSWGVWFCQTYL